MKEKNNLLGKRFERLLVIKIVGKEAEISTDWLCQCDCGNQAIVKGSSLIYGYTKSCGCLLRDINSKKRIDLSGQTFGFLTAHKFVDKGAGHGHWECLCKCGNKTLVLTNNLKNGSTLSCGCKRKELFLKHGMVDSIEFRSWCSMKSRCYNPNNNSYKNYGGRGITVCPEWKDSFETFYKDMGPRPSKKHTLERINSSGNYEPSNCKWADKSEQARNRRNNRKVLFNNVERTIAEISEMAEVNYHQLYYRISLGETAEKAVSTIKNTL